MTLEQQTVLDAWQGVVDPNTGKRFVSTKALKNLQVNDGDVSFDVELDYPAKSQLAGIRKLPVAAAKGMAGVRNVSVNVGFKIASVGLLYARKGIKMFEKVGMPSLGIVEKMAVHVCSQCGHTEHIFGVDGGKKMATDYNMCYLGALPVDMQIRLQAGSGKPTVVADPDGEVAGIYKAVARKMAITIAAKAKDFSTKFPAIKISTGT